MKFDSGIPQDLKNLFLQLRSKAVQKRKWVDEFGYVKNISSIVHDRYRFIVIGSKLICIESTETFFDFLRIYLQQMITLKWIENEMKKNSAHPLINWLSAIHSKLEKEDKGNSEYFSFVPNSKIDAMINLAYDIYTIDHNLKLQDRIIERLRNIDQFYGARYELFVTSLFVRAGFEIDFEDESDKRHKHAEFIATDRLSKEKFCIEAKYKMRNELGENPSELDKVEIGNIARLIHNAIEKNPGMPEIIFIDLNLPVDQAKRIMEGGDHFQTLIRHTGQIQKSIDAKDLFNIVYFTNISELYGSDEKPLPKISPVMMQALNPKYKFTNQNSVRDKLYKRILEYGRIPVKFP